MWLKKLIEWKTGGKPCAIITIIESEGSTPRGVGSKMVVNSEGQIAGSVGGGSVEHISREEAQKAIKEQRCISLTFSLKGDVWQVTPETTVQGLCGGSVKVFIEPVLPEAEVVIFGGGHIGEKISKYCEILEMPYKIFDNREEYTSSERFPAALERVCKPYETLSESIKLTCASYCVVLTHGHKHDETCLEQLLRFKEIPYIGMIGSANKIQVVVNNIRSRGGIIDGRLYSPVGLNIANNLPGQIALGIMAQIILLVNNGKPEHYRIPWHEQA
ncbi:MAG TPA: XdhC/CoxI family protein [Chitinispirillaceae bacterium]|nr:XdhC/CoxI family protein [Chitinispirillaceae bacterium]